MFYPSWCHAFDLKLCKNYKPSHLARFHTLQMPWVLVLSCQWFLVWRPEILYCLFWGHTHQWLVLTSGSELWHHFWRGAEDWNWVGCLQDKIPDHCTISYLHSKDFQEGRLKMHDRLVHEYNTPDTHKETNQSQRVRQSGIQIILPPTHTPLPTPRPHTPFWQTVLQPPQWQPAVEENNGLGKSPRCDFQKTQANWTSVHVLFLCVTKSNVPDSWGQQ